MEDFKQSQYYKKQVQKHKINKYIKKWKNKFNTYWQLYKITECAFETDEFILIENYFKSYKKMHINESQYIIVEQ